MGHSIVCGADSFSIIAIIEQDDRALFDQSFKVNACIKSNMVFQNAEIWDSGMFFGTPDKYY